MSQPTNAPHASNHTNAGRWMSYSLAATAGLGAVAANADADIIYSGTQDISIDQYTALSLDLNLDGYTDIVLKNSSGATTRGCMSTTTPARWSVSTPGSTTPPPCRRAS